MLVSCDFLQTGSLSSCAVGAFKQSQSLLVVGLVCYYFFF